MLYIVVGPSGRTHVLAFNCYTLTLYILIRTAVIYRRRAPMFAIIIEKRFLKQTSFTLRSIRTCRLNYNGVCSAGDVFAAEFK